MTIKIGSNPAVKRDAPPKSAAPRPLTSTLGGDARMSKAIRIYLIVNLIGICILLLIDLSIIHAIHSEHRDSPDFGDSLNFLMAAVPVVLVCFVYNVVWGLKSVLKRDYLGLVALLFIATVWFVLLLMLRMYQ